MSATLSVLEVVCTAIGAFVLYCVVMVALWSGFVRAVRHRARVDPTTGRPTDRRARRTVPGRPVEQRWAGRRWSAALRGGTGWDNAGSPGARRDGVGWDSAGWDGGAWDDPQWDDPQWDGPQWDGAVWDELARGARPRGHSGGATGDFADAGADRAGDLDRLENLGPTGLNPFGSAAAAAAARYEAQQRAERRRASGRD